MATVKGKIRLCQTSLDNFNAEQINGSPFYNRYVEFLRVFNKHLQEFNPEVVFAQPEINEAKGALDWYIPHPQESPETLFDIKSQSLDKYNRYCTERDNLLKKLKEISLCVSNPQEKDYLDCAIKYLNCEYADQVTYCYDDKITFGVWGMKMRKGRDITTIITDDVKDHRTHTVTFVIEGNGTIEGNNSIIRKHGYCLQGRDIPEIKAALHHSFVEWQPEAPQGKPVNTDLIYTAICKRTDDYQIEFISSEGGNIIGTSIVTKKSGESIIQTDIPEVEALSGFHFVGWSPMPVFDEVVSDDMRFIAQFEKEENGEEPSIPPIIPVPPSDLLHHVQFDAGENGQLKGNGSFDIKDGEHIPQGMIPTVEPKSGYKFIGWDKSPYNAVIDGDKLFTAQYEQHIPWYRRWWLWLAGLFAGKGCLKWLLWLLLAILLCWLLSWLLRGCVGCSGVGGIGHPAVNGVVPIDTITRVDNSVVDDNGYTRPVTDNTGRLPEDGSVTAPVLGEGGIEPPIISQPGTPNIIANRLFLFMEDENGDIDGLARDFKQVYPGDQYSIIGYDKEVKLLVIQVPENERDEIRQTINSRIPNHKFIVFDEEIYELNGYVSEKAEDMGWHLDAIHLKQGWTYTKGDSKVRVAVVDDGIQSDHPMFKGRIADAYNVYTQNNKLSVGDGHGTHTAGLAVGSSEFYSKGASGVAPNCTLIPVQVFDNKQCPLSALIAGVMYAVHHDADVVNISIGPSFQGLNVLPVEQQEEIAGSQFRNVAALWARVCKLAAKKKTILVFAAGNDDILTSIPPENRNESSIVVTAVDKRMFPTNFTNYGPCSDISAPGKNIYSAFPTNSYQSCDGTSMAAPIVTGTIALMKSIKKDLTVEQARNALFSTGADVYGWIPPMVLVDKVLAATKAGNFNRIEREGKSVPDGVDVHLHSGQIPINQGGQVIIDNPPVTTPGPEPDYDEIRRLIKEHEDAIRELKKKLPENK